MSGDHKVRVGSRKSELALIQTNYVISLLKKFHPEKEFEIVTMSTLGDKVLDIPLPKIGEKSLFTRELEAALATGCVDFVVHSLKDLPTSLPDNMAICTVLEREDPRDALVLHKDYKDHTLESLPNDSTIGTSSLRRAAQLHKYYPHLKVENIRGNLNTRLKKLDELGKFQAIILATAGIQRMGWNNRISQIIDEDKLLYAVGQGALAVECREKDEEVISLLRPLYDIHTAIRIIVERTFLKTLGGGCSAPVAIKTDLIKLNGINHKLTVTGGVWSLDGTTELKDNCETEIEINNTFCSVCPYRNSTNNSTLCSRNNDVECLEMCKNKVQAIIENETDKDEISNSKAPKRIKLDHHNKTSDSTLTTTNEIDPHDKCPINLPIGVDFMGKCPYLETHTVSKCPVSGHIDGLENIGKCPYMKEGNIISVNDVTSKKIGNQNLFCGLIPHPEISIETFKTAENLGKALAEKLIERGAESVMAKAQAIIRNS